MTIRSRMMMLLLPVLSAFIILISLLFYFYWSQEIVESFKWRLQSSVIATAQTIDEAEIRWIETHLKDPDLAHDPKYQEFKQDLLKLKKKLPITELYIIKLEPLEIDNSYRQIYLIDASGDSINEGNRPGETDFSENDEQRVYFTKKAFVTSIYQSRKTHERFLSAYAPIIGKDNSVIALLGADVSMIEVDQKLKAALFIIFTVGLLTILLLVLSVYLIAEKISKPVRKLNQAALDIAAGEYESNIQVEGPKEIVELASTLSTMSECLADNMHRLKEGSLIRERLYGEKECAQLLQHYMLQKEVEAFKSEDWKIKIASTSLSKNSHGLALRCEFDSQKNLEITLIEAVNKGFASLVDLNRTLYLPLSELTDYNYVNCFFAKDESLRYSAHGLTAPFIWSNKEEQWVDLQTDEVPLHPQDMVFIMNSALSQFFKNREAIQVWMGRVLRHFAKDGIEHIHTIFTNELNFLSRREPVKENLSILIIQGIQS